MIFRNILLAWISAACLHASLTSKIPHSLWQTYKTKELPPTALEARNSWLGLNPEFSGFLYDDADIERYIEQNWPREFLDLLHELPIGAMKADLWRYLMLASHGGVYSDIDSVCLLPIRHWPLGERASGHILLLDLDDDQNQFCQWTFAATPRHPAMYYICHYVMNRWKSQGIPLDGEGKIKVLHATGPIVFSDAIRSYLGEPLSRGAGSIQKQYNLDKTYRERLNRLGIFFTNKGFFNGQGSKNLFWGTWSHRTGGAP